MKKQEVVTVTYCEILNYAIHHVLEKYDNEKRMNEKFKKVDSSMVSDYWKEKLIILLNMYKIETGEEYGYVFDVQ